MDKTMIRTPVVEISLEGLSSEAKIFFYSNFYAPNELLFFFRFIYQ